MTNEQPPATNEATETSPDFFARIPWYTVPALLVGVPALFALIGQVSPWFADNVIWKYYWGPIYADAARAGAQMQNGVIAEPGYNLVNTLSWAVLLGVCVLGIAQLLNRFKQPADTKLVMGATAWVVTGAVWHVLQDTTLIAKPLEYIFITPPIYLLFGAFGIASWLFGVYMRWVAEQTGSVEAGLQKAWFLFSAVVLAYTFMWVAKWDQIIFYVNPIWIALSAVATFLWVRRRVAKVGQIVPTDMLIIFSLGWMLAALAFVVAFQQDPWDTVGSNALPMGILWAPLLAGALTALVFGTAASSADARLGRSIIIASAVVFAATMAWATATGATLGAVLVFVGMLAALVLIPLGLLALLQKNGHIALAIGLLLVGLVVVAIGGILIDRLAHNLADRDLGLMAQAIAAVLVLGYAFSKREALAAKFAAAKAQTGLSPAVALAYMAPINLVLIFSQMVDGFATSLGLDLAGYTEKHVLSAFLIEFFREQSVAVGFTFGATYPTFLAFAPVKLLISLLVIYAIDVASAEDARKYPTMIGLVKFAIIMVGIGPGVRDFVRLAMGV